MWQDSLRTGISKIDEQHKMLFTKVGELIDEAIYTGEYQKDKIIATIVFLKEYAISHFADEEAYQISINDVNYLDHKILHEDFVETILKHEKQMLESDFAHNDVSKFTGTLLAWLAYHVSDVDQKIGKITENTMESNDYTDTICKCFCQTINNYVNMKDRDVNSIVKVNHHDEAFVDSVTFKHTFTHILEGHVFFDFSYRFVSELIFSLTEIPLTKIGNFEKTFLLQISTIIIENIYRCLYVSEYEHRDVEISIIEKDETYPTERVSFDTGIGIVEIGFSFT